VLIYSCPGVYLEADRCLFAAEITYPEYVEYVYANGLREQARRLGLPY